MVPPLAASLASAGSPPGWNDALTSAGKGEPPYGSVLYESMHRLPRVLDVRVLSRVRTHLISGQDCSQYLGVLRRHNFVVL